MNASDYQKAAVRTESPEQKASQRLYANIPLSTRLLHALLGLASETGELATAVKKWIYYGQELDIRNVKEELGDILWYVALACDAADLDMGNVMDWNIRKLRVRFPEAFSEENVKEENRNLAAELQAVTEASSPQQSRESMDGIHPSHNWTTDIVQGKVGLFRCKVCGTVKGLEAAYLPCTPVVTSGT